MKPITSLLMTFFVFFVGINTAFSTVVLTLSPTSSAPNIGDVVEYQVTATGFTDIGGMNFAIQFDTTKLTFLNSVGSFLTSPAVPWESLGINVSTSSGPKRLVVIYNYLDNETEPGNLIGKTVADGTVLFKVRFTRTALGTALVNFNGAILPNPEFTEVLPGNITIPITPVAPITNTSITAGGTPVLPLSLTVEKDTVSQGKVACLDITATGFTNLENFGFGIVYDTLNLKYKDINLCKSNLLFYGLHVSDVNNISVGVNRKVIKVTYAIDGGTPITLPDNTVLMTVCFTQNGTIGTVSPVTISAINDPGTTSLPIEFVSTTGPITDYVLNQGHVVTGNVSTPTLSLGNQTTSKNATVCVPVTVQNFSQIDSFTVKVMYDTLKLRYTNMTAGNLSGVVATQATTLFTVQGKKMRQVRCSFPNQVTPLSLADNQTAFSLCFTALDTTGNPSSTALLFKDTFATCPRVSLFQGTKELYPMLMDGSVTIEVPCDASNTPNLSLTSGVSKTNVACFGGATGSITIAPTGGITPYNITWTGPNGYTGTGATINNLAPGFYVPVITGANGCSATTSQVPQLQITQPTAALTLTQGNIVNVACKGAATGSINISTAGGTGTVTYVWRNIPSGTTVGTGEDVSGLAAGTYNVIATDANGCTTTFPAPLTVSEPVTALSVTGAVTNVTCSGGNNGAIALTIAGGNTGTPSFAWSPSLPNSANVTGLSAGSYNVTVTDAGGCAVSPTSSFNVTAPSQISMGNPTIVPTGCGASTIGSITLNAITGGSGSGYTVSWNNGAFTGTTISNLPVGTYTPVITDGAGCTRSLQSISVGSNGSTITQTPVTITPVSCAGLSNGSIQITPSSSASGALSIAWSVPGQTGNTLSNLSAGTYFVTITDAVLCAQSFTHVVGAAPNNIAASFTSTPDSCGGNSLGTISIVPGSPSGGNAPYSIVWSGTPQTGPNLVGLAAGTYTPTITDASGCMKVLPGIIVGLAPNDIVVSAQSVTPTSCAGSNTGAITIQVTPLTGTYTVNWGNGLIGTTITNLAAGIYTPTVTNQNGCTRIGTPINVANGTFSPTLTPTVTNASCANGTNGAISIQIAPTGTYPVSWGGNLSGTTISNLTPGSYTPTVTNTANGCTSVGNPIAVGVTTNLPTIAPGAVTVTNVSCFGAGDGCITVVPSQGNAPYVVTWTPTNTGSTICNLPGNIYTPTVTDAAGCTFTPSSGYSVFEPQAINFTYFTTSQSIATPPNGAITIDIVSGGTAPYTYSWSPGSATTQNLSNIPAGTYTLTVKDANNCTKVEEIVVASTIPTGLIIGTQTVTNSCGPNNGCVDFVMGNGTPDYTVQWSSGPIGGTSTSTDNSPQACNLAAGTYTFTITDGMGLTVTSTATIVELAPVSVNTIVENPNDDFMNGTITIVPQGGLYTYSWAPPISADNATLCCQSGLDQGSYTVTITNDISGCTSVETFTLVRVYPPASWSITLGKTTCPSTCDGTLLFSFSGANGPNYNYKVTSPTNPAFTPYNNSGQGLVVSLANLCTGSYLLEVTDEGLVIYDSLVTITSQSNLSVTSLITSNYNGFNVSSPTNCDGAALATPANGVGTYSFIWSNGGTSASNSSLCAGNYTVTVTDGNGCTATSTGGLTSPEGVFPTVTQTSNFNGFGVSCDDKSDGHARVTIVGGSLPYTVKWSTGKQDVITTAFGFSDVFNLGAGTYTVTVTDNNGVTAVGTVTITTPGPFYLELDQTRPSTLSACDGYIIATPVNGVGTVEIKYAVAGMTAQGTGPKIEDLCVDRRVTFFATDANGCTATARDTVGYPSDGCFQVDPVITPGTQDGKNDLLTITCIESANSSSLQIFNRWGQLVYTAEGYTNYSTTSWDGTNSSKQLLPEGVYYYVLNFTNEENEAFQQKGYIHLIR